MPRRAAWISLFAAACVSAVVAPIVAQTPDFHLVIRKVAFSPDGRSAVTFRITGELQLRDAKSGKQLTKFEGHEFRVHAVAFSPNGKQLISSDGNNVRVWDARTGKELLKMRGRNGNVSSLAISPDGHYAVSGHSDGSGIRLKVPEDLYLRDLATGENVARTVIEWDRYLFHLFFPNWQQWMPKDWQVDHPFIDFDRLNGEIVRQAEIFEEQEHVNAVAFSPDSKRVICGRGDGTARILDVATGRELNVLKGHQGNVWSVSFSPDGRLAVTAGEDGMVRLWRVPGSSLMRQPARLIHCFDGHEGSAYSAAFSKDGRSIVSGGEDMKIRIWDTHFGLDLIRSLSLQSPITSVAFSPDGKSILCGSYEDEFWQWIIPPLVTQRP